MLKKLSAILMLFSFLIVVIHGMIPHTHQELRASELISSHQHPDDHFHTSDAHHHHHASQNKEHQIPSENEGAQHFPLHFHHSVTNDFDFIQTDFSESFRYQLHVEFLTITDPFKWGYVEPSDKSDNDFKELPPILLTFFEPGSIALRAPPSFA